MPRSDLVYIGDVHVACDGIHLSLPFARNMLSRSLRLSSLLKASCRPQHAPPLRMVPPRARVRHTWEPARAETLFQRVDRQPDAVLWSIVGANVAVFAAWQVVDPRLMFRNFAVSEESLERGRLHTVVTASFSQRDGWHLGGNMLSLYFFGREVGQLFGGVKLAGLYLAGGVIASLSHVAWTRYRRPEHQLRFAYWAPPAAAALGASGSVNAIIVFNTLLFPWRIIYVNFILPVPAIALGGLVLLRDAFGASGGRSDGIAHAGHLGGAAVGAAAWGLLRMRRF